MDDLRKQVLQLTGKYDTLVRDVKILKTKLKKDESTITTLQREVIQLKKQRPNLSNNNSQNANNLNNVNIAKDILSASAPPVTSNLNQAMDPLDMIFGGGGSNKATQNNGTANNTQNNPSGAGGFGSWTTF